MLSLSNLRSIGSGIGEKFIFPFQKTRIVNEIHSSGLLRISKLENKAFSTNLYNFHNRAPGKTSGAFLVAGNGMQTHRTEAYALKTDFVQVRMMAGHAKWQNVKHVKAEKDRLKSAMCSKYAHLARNAVREKGPDPKMNERLAAIIEEARKHNVPMSTIEKAMKADSNAKMKSGFIEISGPGGSFIIIDYETDNISIIRHSIKQVLKKYGSSIIQGEGRWRAVFDKKGIVKVVGITSGQSLNKDDALDAAIEAGAEDVIQKVDDDSGKPYLEFHCDVDELHSVKKELEKKSYEIEDAYVGFIPNINVELSPDDTDLAGNMISDLEDVEGVIRIYENVQF